MKAGGPYTYESYEAAYFRAAHESRPVTVVSSRVRDLVRGVAVVMEVGTWAVWLPWTEPTEYVVGEVRFFVMPYGPPVEGSDVAYRRAVERGVRSGVVSACVLRYGVRMACGIDDARVVEAVKEWEAFQSFAQGGQR